MAETVQFDLVSPERSVASLQVSEVQIPGSEGDMTAMANHSPLITALRPGVLKVTADKGTSEYVVTGGFAEINEESISVLAEQAIPRDDITQEQFKAMVDRATDALAKLQENAGQEAGQVDDAAKLLADMVAIGDQIGMSAG